jgi:hypothetical protein
MNIQKKNTTDETNSFELGAREHQYNYWPFHFKYFPPSQSVALHELYKLTEGCKTQKMNRDIS